METMPTELIYFKTTAEQILSHPTWDIISVFALIAGGFFYGISAGKVRIAASIMYTYVAFALFSSLPVDRWTQSLNFAEAFLIKIAGFIALLLFFAFMLGGRRKRSIAFSTSWWQVFLLSFLQVGLLIHILVGFLPPDKLKMLAPLTKNLFANPNLHIWWFILPLAALIILRRIGGRED